MKIAISAETTVDLQKDLLDFYSISTVPYTLMFGEKAQFDGIVVGEDLFKYTEETGKLAKTSCSRFTNGIISIKSRFLSGSVSIEIRFFLLSLVSSFPFGIGSLKPSTPVSSSRG